MNFLQLAQRLRREISDTGDGPAGVTNQSGRNLEYVDAIREAWSDIQIIRQWSDNFYASPYSKDNLQLLQSSIDTPFIPEYLHLGIVYYALANKALSQNAQELVLKAQAEWDKYLSLLCRDYLPTAKIGQQNG
ncbi:hypothetical protein [Gallibacterium genomosp. 1]|uniref:hypothetical protein n=1 Tax=Gallibacterium genomosp. 1 TaxID=155515 RepID=UPI0008026506|nr:hypothetical protein [Gallibacterium genomosp. 1]OBX02203.1 hypothetical protein QV04_03995 [Gallibacterium genomosp. 1]